MLSGAAWSRARGRVNRCSIIICRAHSFGHSSMMLKNGRASWLQGKAYDARRGKWEVRNLRPWITPGEKPRSV
jgi:hypothetical protein